MEEKILGKIKRVDFGLIRGFLLGPVFEFSLSGSSAICCGGKYTVNVSDEAKWDSDAQKLECLERMNKFVYKILNDAKVNHVEELNNVPVMVTIENNTFKDFRILTEVI